MHIFDLCLPVSAAIKCYNVVKSFCRCKSKEKYSGEIVYKNSGDVALDLPYTATVEPSVPSQHNDEVVIQVSTNDGTILS